MIEEIYLADPGAAADEDGGRDSASRPSTRPPRTTTSWSPSTPSCESALKAYEKKLPAKQAEWEKQFKTVVAVDARSTSTEAKSKGGATLTKQPDGSILAERQEPGARRSTP